MVFSLPSRYDRKRNRVYLSSMPNPAPVQSALFKQKQFRRALVPTSCVPADVPLAPKAIAVKLPDEVDKALRGLGKQKAAWLREVICKAALHEGLVDKL